MSNLLVFVMQKVYFLWGRIWNFMRGIGSQNNTAFKKGASETFWQTRFRVRRLYLGGGVQGPQVDLAVRGVWAETRYSVTEPVSQPPVLPSFTSVAAVSHTPVLPSLAPIVAVSQPPVFPS
jgi:hypothetical protein